MESCDPVGTQMEIKDKLDLDQNGTLVDATKYHSMIGALLYLTSSRPDIVHSTCLCAQYQAKPTEKHLKEVKRIFHYLRGTVNTGLWYTKDSSFELTGFSDVDYAGCKDSFKSTSGGAQFLDEKLVNWSLKKQDCTTLSTAEAEYVSLSVCCFIDADHPSYVYKLKKALYGLKQATGPWYDELSTFLLQNHFFKGIIDPTLFIRRFHDDILVVQVYVDDIIFGSTHPSTPMEIKDKLDLDQNGTLVDATKYRSMIGALMYITSSRPDIVHATCLCARYQAKPTEKHLKEVKKIFRYLRGTVNTSLWYTKDFGFELTRFLDDDYARCKDTFKSTSGGAQFLGEKLVSWSSKKQDSTAMSTAKAEYVSLSAYYAQVIWMRTQLTDYGFHFNKIPIYCDSKSAIAISCNPVQHSRTKHIVVRYHFIKEHVEKGTIELYFVKTDYQLAGIFTKALPTDRFNYLVCSLGMRSLSPNELERLEKS
nr:retrovirus-related Pol polyprotein from transposon TNT 1-94 [Tanacetum cinerariifolium]